MMLNQLIQLDKEAQQYFSTLPVNVQETLMQIGQEYYTVEDLRKRGEQLINRP